MTNGAFRESKRLYVTPCYWTPTVLNVQSPEQHHQHHWVLIKNAASRKKERKGGREGGREEGRERNAASCSFSLKTTKSETLGWGPSNLCFNKQLPSILMPAKIYKCSTLEWISLTCDATVSTYVLEILNSAPLVQIILSSPEPESPIAFWYFQMLLPKSPILSSASHRIQFLPSVLNLHGSLFQ